MEQRTGDSALSPSTSKMQKPPPTPLDESAKSTAVDSGPTPEEASSVTGQISQLPRYDDIMHFSPVNYDFFYFLYKKPYRTVILSGNVWCASYCSWPFFMWTYFLKQ